MKALLLTTLFCCSFLVLSAQSGVLKTIGGAAKTKVEQQDFNSSRSNKEKGQLRDDRKRSSPAPGSAPESAPAPPADTTTTEPIVPALITPAKYDASYTFGHRLTYAVTDPSEKNKETDTVSYFYSDGAIMTAIHGKETSILADFANESTITFDEEKKTAVAMNSRWAAKAASRQAEQNDEVTITKTGQTKQILGYSCEEYVIQGKTKSVCWITKEITLDYSRTTAAIAHSMQDVKSDDLTSEGLMMEMTGYNKKGVANVHMVLTGFQEERVVKVLSGYSVTGL
jgi:hypothetical protein